MANISRRKAEDRRTAVLNWFLAHPRATGLEAQQALMSGKITGKKETSMNTHTLYSLQRQAQQLGGGTQPVRAQIPAGERIEGPARKKLRELAQQLQEALAEVPDIKSLRIDRVSVSVEEVTVQERPL